VTFDERVRRQRQGHLRIALPGGEVDDEGTDGAEVARARRDRCGDAERDARGNFDGAPDDPDRDARRRFGDEHHRVREREDRCRVVVEQLHDGVASVAEPAPGRGRREPETEALEPFRERVVREREPDRGAILVGFECDPAGLFGQQRVVRGARAAGRDCPAHGRHRTGRGAGADDVEADHVSAFVDLKRGRSERDDPGVVVVPHEHDRVAHLAETASR